MWGNEPPCPCVSTGDGSNLWWPAAYPSSNLDYAANVCAELLGSGDTIAAVSLAIQPSGAGEMQALDLGVTGGVVIAQLAGGQPGRVYQVLLLVTGASGRVWPSLIEMVIRLGGALPCSAQVAPVAAFGTPINWTPEGVVFGSPFATVASNLTATGTGQTTAFPLLAYVNEFSSVPTGTGAILPAVNFVSGTIAVQNNDPVNNEPIYPPIGAQINNLAVNAPFVVGSLGGRINFSTNSPTTQWFAG